MNWNDRMKSTNGEISDAQIADLELKLGGKLKLPEDYRSFLQSCNGGVPINTMARVIEDGDESRVGVIMFYGFTGRPESETKVGDRPCLAVKYRRHRLAGIGRNTNLPIAADGGGNHFVIYCVGRRFGQVWFLTTEGRKFFHAPSFEQFFVRLEFDDDDLLGEAGPPPEFTTPWEEWQREEERDRADGAG